MKHHNLFYCLTVLLLGLPMELQAQRLGPPGNGDNIVPNPGFERFVGKPERWFYSGSDFRKGPKYWFSATTASPDAYGPGIKVPRDWAEKGFGNQNPHRGKGMAGITVYGCTNGKPHCREYIQVQLAEPLVIGQHYYVAFWAAALKKGMYINKLGAYFSISPIARTTDEILVRKAQCESDTLVQPLKTGDWVRVSGFFEARYEAEHIIIGNFNEDEQTQALQPLENGYSYAYYYIDDVVVKKVPPFLSVPVKPDDLSVQPLGKGKTFQLKNIYFEFDRSELMPRSYVELAKLQKILTDHPGMQISIVGHTDSLGSDAYNETLALQRANAVVQHLRQNGISASRLKAIGAGEKKPIASNDTEEGRALNRRVEFIIDRMK
ncbi:MAG: OmpA family protein [Lewinellaceae bacterium]|nr:OmpA family protein [Lewinellaceae bacterium]